MSCYLFYAVTPVVEVAFLPAGYLLAGQTPSNRGDPPSSIFSDKYAICQSDLNTSPLLPVSRISITNTKPGLLDKPTLSPSGPSTRSAQDSETDPNASKNPRRLRRRERTSLRTSAKSRIEARQRHRRRGGDSHSAVSSTGDSASMHRGSGVYPLFYCEVCRVKLNAAGQARQHFEGKVHAKKMKLAESCRRKEAMSPGGSDDGISSDRQSMSEVGLTADCQTDKPSPSAISNPDIYCKICGISFNSDKQSKQHYRGKLHAKKQRLANHLTRCAARRLGRTLAVADAGLQLTLASEGDQNRLPQRIGSKENCRPRAERPETSAAQRD